MDKVKIKRVKRQDKKITTAEKVLAGMGTGAALLGAAGVIAPQPGENKIIVGKNLQDTKSQKTQAKNLVQKYFGDILAKTAKASEVDDSEYVSEDVEDLNGSSGENTTAGFSLNSSSNSAPNQVSTMALNNSQSLSEEDLTPDSENLDDASAEDLSVNNQVNIKTTSLQQQSDNQEDLPEDAENADDPQLEVQNQEIDMANFNGLKMPENLSDQEDMPIESADESADLESQDQDSKHHTIKAGDTLWELSQKYYGNGSKWEKILKANPHLKDQYSLRIGMDLVIP